MAASKDYVAIATKYAQDVVAKKIPACKWVILACRRQLKDLDRKRFAYRFDTEHANRVCRFIELLTHTSGELAGTRIKLEPWQIFLLTTVFGWLNKKDDNRRFRRVYIEVPRGNGKSCLSSGVALYCLLADREQGAEVYSFATTRDQAKIVFGDAKVMAQNNANLRKQFGLEVLANALYVPRTNSTFQAKSAEGSTLDGLKTHLAVVDELHAHKTRAVYDVVETSLGKRGNSLLWVITTAGFDTAGICYEVRGMVTKVLSGDASDDRQFGIIYGLDENDDWKTESALIKANPNWDVSVRPEIIQGLQSKAIVMSSAKNNFLTKHLNVWCNASNNWMDLTKYDQCADETLNIEDFCDEECCIGLDLATKRDIAAKILLFCRKIDGKSHFFLFPSFYLCEAGIQASGNSQYAGWVDDGYLIATPGETTNFDQIEDDIRGDFSRFSISQVGYDPWQATQLATSLSNSGLPMVEVRQTVQMLSEPMKNFEALVLETRLHHDGNPVMRWMVSNVVAHLDAKENIFPRKERPENKIDGLVAALIALSRFDSINDEVGDFSEFLAEPLTMTW